MVGAAVVAEGFAAGDAGGGVVGKGGAHLPPSATSCRGDRGPSTSARTQANCPPRRSNRTTSARVSAVSPSITTPPMFRTSVPS